MGTLSAKPDDVALDAIGAEDNCQRKAETFQHGALLDMELEIRRCVRKLPTRLQHPIEVDAVPSEHVRQRRTLGVSEVAELTGDQTARDRARTEQTAAEAKALLVGPVDESHGRLRPALAGDPAQDLQPRQHVQTAVEPAAVGDGVEMPADQHCPLRVTRQRSPEIACLVRLHPHGQGLELLPEPAACQQPGLGPTDTLSTIGVPGQRVQLLELCNGPRGVEHGATVGDAHCE